VARPNAVINAETKKMSNPALRRFLKNGAKFRQVVQPLLHFTLSNSEVVTIYSGRLSRIRAISFCASSIRSGVGR
jgi:hypothetical protein